MYIFPLIVESSLNSRILYRFHLYYLCLTQKQRYYEQQIININYYNLQKMSNRSEASNSHVHDNCRCDYSYLRKKGPKFQGQTTTQAHYKPWAVQKQTSYQIPSVKTKQYDPEVLQTSYKMQYVKPQLPKNDYGVSSNSLMQSYQSRKAKVPFYSETEYKSRFEPKEVRVQKLPVYQYKPKQTKFEGQSSYKQQYTPKTNNELINAGQQMVSAQKLYQQKPKIKFEGQTSYGQTYKKHNVQVQKLPQYKYQPKNVKFEGESSYKTTHVKLPQSAYKSEFERCPAHPDRMAIK